MPITPEQAEKISRVTPMDDLTIRLMLRKNPRLAERICRIVLRDDTLRVLKVETQYDASRGGIARGITLDALVDDNQGRIHNLEIQLDARGLNPERGRYHASILDVEHLDAGKEFMDLSDTFVIFLCDNDPYGKGAPIYVVERRVRTEDGKDVQAYGDRQYILYVNGDWAEDDELGKLVHDFHCSDPQAMFYPEMAERLRYLKGTERGQMELLGLAAELYSDKQRQAAIKLLEMGLTKPQIALALDMPQDIVAAIAEEIAGQPE